MTREHPCGCVSHETGIRMCSPHFKELHRRLDAPAVDKPRLRQLAAEVLGESLDSKPETD